MKKIFGITFGGLQRKLVTLVLLVLLITVAGFAIVAYSQSKMLTDVVEETRVEQQQAISQVSDGTMHAVLESSLSTTTALQANLADNDFSEIISYVYMLQTMAEGLLAKRDRLNPSMPSLPDPALDGTPSSYLLCEEGVDYTQSKYLGIIAHMSSSMIAMLRNSDKVDSCYVGLADGTDFCADYKSGNKYDEKGNFIYFPVRERPWYVGAINEGDIYFTGIMKDAYSGEYLVTCSVPVVVSGETLGVVGIDIILESMNDFVKADSSEGSHAYVVNDQGKIIIGPDEDDVFGGKGTAEATDLHSLGNEALSQFIDKALKEVNDLTEITINGKAYYLASAPMPTVGWTVINVVDKELTEQPEHQMLAEYDRINEKASAKFYDGTDKVKTTILWFMIILFFLALAAAMFVARRLVKPIEHMTNSIVMAGKNGQVFEMEDIYKTNDEIETLAEAFEDLSKKTRNYIGQITKITAEKERISTELSLATRIQAAMMPHIFPPFPGRTEVDLYATMNPAKEVGGDFYDFFLIDEDHLCMVIADVSGKGIPAALFMMASKIILQSCAMLGGTPAEILTKTNQAICSNNQEEMFVTVWLGILEISTGKLTAANAGHEYPVIKQPGGKFELIKDKHGLVIGAMESTKYKEYEIKLEPGAKLFVYTDGIPEATNAQSVLFGVDRMIDALNNNPDPTPTQVLEGMRASVDQFVQEAEQFDDLTMLCMEYKGANTVHELTVEAVRENLLQVQAFVDEKLEVAEVPAKTIMQMDVALEEIFVNVANYAYVPNKGNVTVRVETSSQQPSVTLTFLDHGVPYNPLEKEDPDVTLSADEREIGGLGIFMTKKMMDEITYERRGDQNILTMKKNL